MEKNIQKIDSAKRILITGPESTGKSELASSLASCYQGVVIPEYAREYMVGLGRHYVYEDVEIIARHQSEAYGNSMDRSGWIFFDTWLIITKVWFEIVYGKAPEWIDGRIRESRFDLVLLCDTDIPWIPDPVRENGGEMRERLMERYRQELQFYGLKWETVKGSGQGRVDHAIQHLNLHLQHG